MDEGDGTAVRCSTTTTTIFRRVVLNASRLALIHAASRGGPRVKNINADDLRWGWQVADHFARWVAWRAESSKRERKYAPPAFEQYYERSRPRSTRQVPGVLRRQKSRGRSRQPVSSRNELEYSSRWSPTESWNCAASVTTPSDRSRTHHKHTTDNGPQVILPYQLTKKCTNCTVHHMRGGLFNSFVLLLLPPPPVVRLVLWWFSTHDHDDLRRSTGSSLNEATYRFSPHVRSCGDRTPPTPRAPSRARSAIHGSF